MERINCVADVVKIIKKQAKVKGIRVSDLADVLYCSRDKMYDISCGRRGLSVDDACTMLDYLGYEVVVKKKK